ncbi:DUF4129 domain-containing protein [Streptomyces hoynatensis]|uniref:DUF4129 domain-containing protein n=1 Tax=Streptomyces hoynatensis TaxID=1141874 RepID=A0A3A9YVT7_9ACTN|nr:DUF4129 domain-containing protein [Streptomyces hoynatensis]
MLTPLAAGPPGPPVTVDREQARREAAEELSRQIYAAHRPGPFRRAWNWLWDHLFHALETAAFHTPGGWLGLLLIALLAAGLLLALRLRLGALRNAAGPGRRTALFPDGPRSAAQHRAAAEEHAAAARWEQAVLERMRALVRSLEERALLDPRPGRTAHEAAAEATRPLPALGPELTAAAATFDAVAYGGLPATPADYARLADLDTRLRHTTPDLTAPAWAAP